MITDRNANPVAAVAEMRVTARYSVTHTTIMHGRGEYYVLDTEAAPTGIYGPLDSIAHAVRFAESLQLRDDMTRLGVPPQRDE